MRLLKAVLVLELLLGTAWTLPQLRAEYLGMGILMLLAFTYPFQLPCMAIAAWRFARQPETRRLATIVFLTPVALLFVPGILRGLFGVPVFAKPHHAAFVFLVPLSLASGYCVLVPRRAAAHLPDFLLASRWLNVGLLLLAAGGLLGAVLLVSWYVQVMPEEVSGIALGLLLTCIVAGSAASLPIAVYSWVGLFQSRDTRQQGLRVAQLVASSLVLLGTLAVMALTLAARSLSGLG